MAKSPTYSCISYELFVGGEKGNDDNNKEKMSIRSVEVESESVSVIQRQPAPTTAHQATKVRKVSTVSIPSAGAALFFTFLSIPVFCVPFRSVSLHLTSFLYLYLFRIRIRCYRSPIPFRLLSFSYSFSVDTFWFWLLRFGLYCTQCL